MKTFIVILLTIITVNCYGQGFKISGVVLKDEDGQPAIGCYVTVIGRNVYDYADSEGSYGLQFAEQIKAGAKLKLNFDLDGYTHYTKTVSANNIEGLNIRLKKKKPQKPSGSTIKPSLQKETVLNPINYYISELKKPDIDGRVHAAKVLGDMGPAGKAAIYALVDAFVHNADSGVKFEIVRSLDKIGERSMPVEEILRIALNNKSQNIRVASLRAIRRLKINSASVIRDLKIAIENKNVQVRIEAAATLRTLRPSENDFALHYLISGLNVSHQETLDTTYNYLQKFDLTDEAESIILGILGTFSPRVITLEMEEERAVKWEEIIQRRAMVEMNRYFQTHPKLFSSWILQNKIPFEYVGYYWPKDTLIPSLTIHAGSIIQLRQEHFPFVNDIVRTGKSITPYLDHLFRESKREAKWGWLIVPLTLIDSSYRPGLDSVLHKVIDRFQLNALLLSIGEYKEKLLPDWQNAAAGVAFNAVYYGTTEFTQDVGNVALELLLKDKKGMGITIAKIREPSAFIPCHIYKAPFDLLTIDTGLIRSSWRNILMNLHRECENSHLYGFIDRALTYDLSFRDLLRQDFRSVGTEDKRKILSAFPYIKLLPDDESAQEKIAVTFQLAEEILADPLLSEDVVAYMIKVYKNDHQYASDLQKAEKIVEKRELKKLIKRSLH